MDQMGAGLGWVLFALKSWTGRQGQGGIVISGKQTNDHRKAGQAGSPKLSSDHLQE